MRIAVLADIHGNILALEAVLKDLEHQESVDQLVVAGDLFAFGPAPNEVLARLRGLPHVCFLLGNTDRYLLEASYPPTDAGGDWRDKLLFSFHWTAERLEGEGFRFLKTLPAFQIVSDSGRQILAVHGSPRSDEEALTVETEADEFAHMSIGPQVAVLACGHTHIPMDRSVGNLRVVNAGSVGLPFDGDTRACYTVISISNSRANLEHRPEIAGVQLRRVAYDVEQAVEQLIARDHPAADVGAFNLRSARSIGTNLIYTPRMRHRGNVPVVSDQG